MIKPEIEGAVLPPPVEFGYRSIVLRRAGVAMRWRARPTLMCVALVVLTSAVTAWALTLGDYPLTLAQVWAGLIDVPDAGFARTVVMEWRAPRALAAIVFGAGLAVAGAVFQSLTRNPLASPDIIGFSTGSYTGALIVIIVIGGSFSSSRPVR